MLNSSGESCDPFRVHQIQVCSAALGHMRLLLDPACEAALQNSELKVMLRVVRTVLRQFHTQLKAKCGAFVEALLAGNADSILCMLSQTSAIRLLSSRLPLPYRHNTKLHHLAAHQRDARRTAAV